MQRTYISSEIRAEKALRHGRNPEDVEAPIGYEMEREEIEARLSDYVCFDCKTVRFLCQCESTCPNHDCGRPRWHILTKKDGYLEFVWRCEICDDFSDEWQP